MNLKIMLKNVEISVVYIAILFNICYSHDNVLTLSHRNSCRHGYLVNEIIIQIYILHQLLPGNLNFID